ncbi:MAG TPA: DUF4350 domain-containing protein [Polyangiaceae bacterium]|nr:DUF4350 domain-containing protein [Polyangiaceae bacterium]
MVALLLAPAARAVPYDFDGDSWEGCSVFLDVLRDKVGRNNVVATSELRWENLNPRDALVVIYPLRELNADELSSFLRAGGRVAILDDFGASEANLKRFQIERIPAPSRPARTLRNNPALAIVESVVDMVAGVPAGVHPAVADVVSIVTNHPTALTHPNLTPTLRIAAMDEPDGIVAVAGQVGRGRLFVVGDSSVVINQMMRYPGNRAFVQGLGAYLSSDDTWGERKGTIYVVARSFQETGTFENRSSVGKSLGAAGRAFRRWLAETRAAGLPSSVIWALGMIASVISLLWVGKMAARTYPRRSPRFAWPTPLVAQGGVAGRAAVLTAPSTHKALALLEIKSAMEESVAARFDLPLPLSTPDLFETVERSGALELSELKQFKHLLLTLSTVETSVAAGTPLRVRERDVQAAIQKLHHLLARIDEKGSSR